MPEITLKRQLGAISSGLLSVMAALISVVSSLSNLRLTNKPPRRSGLLSAKLRGRSTKKRGRWSRRSLRLREPRRK